jgi:hypothetical protein
VANFFPFVSFGKFVDKVPIRTPNPHLPNDAYPPDNSPAELKSAGEVSIITVEMTVFSELLFCAGEGLI